MRYLYHRFGGPYRFAMGVRKSLRESLNCDGSLRQTLKIATTAFRAKRRNTDGSNSPQCVKLGFDPFTFTTLLFGCNDYRRKQKAAERKILCPIIKQFSLARAAPST